MGTDLGHRVVAKLLVFVAAVSACAGAIVCLRVAVMWRAQAWSEAGISLGLVAMAWGLAGLLFRQSLRVERGPGDDGLQARHDAVQQRLGKVRATADALDAGDPEVAALLIAQADLDDRANARRRHARWVVGLFAAVAVALAAGMSWILVRVAAR